MLLQNLAEFKTVNEAAKAMAGNWESWQCFVWFGSKDVPNSDKVMLGYLINNECTLRQLTNMEYVKAQLSEWWGDMTEGAMAGDFGSSVSGDANVLNGLMLRVYDDQGKITKPFRELYKIAKNYVAHAHNLIIDDETFERVQKREMLCYVYRHLEYECQQRKHPFSAELVESVTKELISNEVDFDNDDMDHEIDDLMGWVEDEDEDED